MLKENLQILHNFPEFPVRFASSVAWMEFCILSVLHSLGTHRGTGTAVIPVFLVKYILLLFMKM